MDPRQQFIPNNSEKPDLQAAAAPVSFTGCVVSQSYFLLQAGDYGASFAVEASDGTRRGFRFGDPRIWFVPDGPSLSTNSRKARQWEQIMTSVERATVAGHPVTFRYTMPGNTVTQIRIDWSANSCAG